MSAEFEESTLPLHLFEQAIAHCASGLIICDAHKPGMPIVYASPSFELLTGYAASEAVGKDCLFLQNEETDQIGIDDIRSAFEKGVGCKVLLRSYHKSGRPFWNEVTLSPIKDGTYVTHYVGTQIDISHYLETFKALQESESRYRHLYEETPAMLHSVDSEGHIVSVSHYWLEKLGYQRHEVIGRPISNFLTSSGAQGEEQQLLEQPFLDKRILQAEIAEEREDQQINSEQTLLKSIKQAGKSADLEAANLTAAGMTKRDVPCQFLKKGGDRIDTLLSSISECTTPHTANAQSCRTLSVSVDITERKKVEETLRRNEALMRAINNLPPTGIFVMDCETTEALFVNAEFYKIWQLEPLQSQVDNGAITGEQLLSECLSHVDLSAFVATSTAEDFSNGTKIVEDEVPLLDGRTLRRIYGPIQENNVTFAYLYVFEDITQRKQSVQQLAAATEAAEAASKAKSEFLANMSHELRSPLNAILGFTHILKESNPKPEQRENLEIIYNSGEHLLALINDILDISKIEAGRVVLTEIEFDLHQLLSEVQQMFLNAAHRKGLSLSVSWTADVPQWVQSDRLKLRQILINLLSNAIKFTEFGRIGVLARVESADSDANLGQHAHQPTAHRKTLHFAVTDTGSGIAPADQTRLFEAFVQTQSGLTSHEGTGLGLTISQEYVRLLGGQLAVESEIDKGSTFSFAISVKQGNAAHQTAVDTRKIVGLAPNQPTYRILVVDDVAVNRKLLTHLMSTVGFDVREACNGKEAIAQWQTWQPDLIWIDMQMPVMTGEEAAIAIRASDPNSATKIIALTASAFEENKLSALNSGCDDFVSKPVQAASVFSKLAQHLGVQYRYEAPPPLVSTQQAVPISTSLLASAPQDWLYALTQATLDLDDGAILSLAQQLPPAQQDLATAVRACVNTLSYKKLLTALEGVSRQEADASSL